MPAQVHIITDTTLQERFTHLELAELAIAGGADVVQYRNKSYDPVRDRAELEAIMALPRPAHCRIIVNDDAALAAAVGADGVHLGREDGSPAEARALLGPGALIGATVHALDELHALEGQPIDYIGVGPLFGTHSKHTGLPPLGTDGLARICAASPWPVIAIGGIDAGNADLALEAGARGVAVIGAFCLSSKPSEIVPQLRYAHYRKG